MQPADLKPLSAPHVLADHHVVAPDHISSRLRESGFIAFVGAAGELLLLRPDQPLHFVIVRLVAMRTIQVVLLLFRPFVVKVALFHAPIMSYDPQLSAPPIEKRARHEEVDS